jgi:predicted dehydrogenase
MEEPSVVLYSDNEVRSFHHIPADWAESFRLGGRDFVDAILKGRKPPQQPEDARKILAFSLAAAKSALENREVAIKELG